MSNIELIQGDCLEKMKDIPDGSVDMVLTDPPYNIQKAEWDKWKTKDAYIEWCGKWLLECQRVLKDNGSFYFFHNDMVQIAMLMEWIRQNSKFIFKQFIVWNKYYKGSKNEGYCKRRLSNGQNRNYYAGFTEYCLYYTFQDETGLTTVMLDTNNFPTMRKYFKELQEFIGLNKKQILEKIGQKADHCFRWNSSQWDLPTKETYQELIDVFKIDKWQGFKEYENLRQEYENLRQEYENLRQEYENLRYTFNNQHVMVDDFSSQNWNNNVWNYEIAKKKGHITPKPVDLIENIIKHSSNEGDTVLDFMMGIGTTGVACKNLNRNFIGIEINEEYFKIAEKRINENI